MIGFMNVSFEVKNHSSNAYLDNFTVTTIFHWGDEENGENYTDTVITDDYPIGSTVSLSGNHTYTEEGLYEAGYSILFGNGSASCEGKNVSIIKLLKFEQLPDLCAWSEIPPTSAPSPHVVTGSDGIKNPISESTSSVGKRVSPLFSGIAVASAVLVFGLWTV